MDGRGQRLATIIRDPLWNNIRVEPLALELIDTPEFQRLRYVRQLGLAYLVYPGATHTRFEHALGTYHLSRRALGLLQERGVLAGVPPGELVEIQCAALLHDVGHYPYSHALEEIGAPHHEGVASTVLASGPLGDALRRSVAADAPEQIAGLIRGTSGRALQGLISSSLDLDKIEYLKRDALMCGVPYGEIDVDRLLHSLTLVRDPRTGGCTVGVHEKGLAALESLLFAKYQMYRNVYWHHAVRSATAMYKRLIADALASRALEPDALATETDEGLLHRLQALPGASPLLAALRGRRLYKRAFECVAGDLPDGAGDWIAANPVRARAAEDALADELHLGRGEVLLDFPAKQQMLGLDIAVERADGAVRQLTAAGWPGAINLPVLAEQLVRTARVLRVFVARPVTLDRQRVLALLG